MKKNYSLKSKLALSLVGLGLASISSAQVATTYTFSQSNNVYTPITGGAVVGTPTDDDAGYSALNIGFTFKYDNVCYTKFGFQTNGSMTFGSALPYTSYTAIGDLSSNSVAALNDDLQSSFWTSAVVTSGSPVAQVTSTAGISVGDLIASGYGFPAGSVVTAVGATNFTANQNATSSLSGTFKFSNGEARYQTIGSAPNRKLVIQWKNLKKYGTSGTNDCFNFQVILEETTNKISIVYGSMNVGASTGPYAEVGLVANSSYNNRTTGTDWSATTNGTSEYDDCYMASSGVILPTSGLTFDWNGAPTVGPAPVVSIAITGGSSLICGTSGTRGLTASGASTYLWNTGSTSASINPSISSTTTYTVSGTNAACASAEQVVTITVAPIPVVTIAGASSFCSNTPSDFTAGGASSYQWNTGSGSNVITPTASGTYSVIGTSVAGCTATATKSFILNPAPSVTLTVTGPTFGCPTSTLTNVMTASGANTYSWSTGATTAVINPTSTVSTVYTVVGTALNGCTDSKSSSIVISNPVLTVSSSANPLCIGEPFATLTAGGASTYTWSTGVSTTTINVTPATTTSYTLAGTTSTCSAFVVFTQSVSACTGIEETSNTTLGVSVYPNPNNGEFTIELNNGLSKTIEVADITGRIVALSTTTNDKINFNMSDLTQGIYYVKVISNDRFEVIKIVKQ